MSDPLKTDDIDMSPSVAAQEAEEAKGKTGKAKAETAVDEPVEATAVAETLADVTADAEQPETADAEAEKPDEEKGRKRGKPASERIAELTKSYREEQRARQDLEARLARLESGATKPEGPQEPDPEKYEFGSADPQYIADRVDFLVADRVAKTTEDRQAKDAQAADTARREAMGKELDASWKAQADKATERYPDFHETVIESANNQEWELLPLSAAAVAGSDVGADIAYHLATHPDEAKKLADAERDVHAAIAAARKAGLSEEVTQLMARPALRRAQELFEGVEGQCKAKPKGKTVTSAPEPPAHGVRGAGGRFSPDFSNENCDLSELAKAIRG